MVQISGWTEGLAVNGYTLDEQNQLKFHFHRNHLKCDTKCRYSVHPPPRLRFTFTVRPAENLLSFSTQKSLETEYFWSSSSERLRRTSSRR